MFKIMLKSQFSWSCISLQSMNMKRNMMLEWEKIKTVYRKMLLQCWVQIFSNPGANVQKKNLFLFKSSELDFHGNFFSLEFALWVGIHKSPVRLKFSQFSHSGVSDSLWPHELEDVRLPCSSSTPRRQFSSVAQSFPTLCNPMNHSKPGLPVHHQLAESTQTNVNWVGDAIQPSPTALNLSGIRSFQMSQLFTSGGQSIGVSASTSVLPMNTQEWSPLGWTSWISLQSKRLSRVFSNTTIKKHQFFSTQLSL